MSKVVQQMHVLYMCCMVPTCNATGSCISHLAQLLSELHGWIFAGFFNIHADTSGAGLPSSSGSSNCTACASILAGCAAAKDIRQRSKRVIGSWSTEWHPGGHAHDIAT